MWNKQFNRTFTVNKFFDKFHHYLATVTSKPGFPIVCGDLNFHLEDQTNSSSVPFQNLIDITGFIQHISEPTHITNAALDVVITKSPQLMKEKVQKLKV